MHEHATCFDIKGSGGDLFMRTRVIFGRDAPVCIGCRILPGR
jgi:hypothetical protein